MLFTGVHGVRGLPGSKKQILFACALSVILNGSGT